MKLGLSSAKWGYVTRRVTGHDELRVSVREVGSTLGAFVVARVAHLGAHNHLEGVHGRRVRLFRGDVVVGAFGNRYATDFYEGYLPTADESVHLLTSGGLIGTVASSHSSKGAPTELEVLGGLTDRHGRPLTTDSVAIDIAAHTGVSAELTLATIVVVGSSMNAGKTTVAASLVHGLSRAGLRVGAAKVTGSGSGKDYWAYLDAGAGVVTDFLDFGMPSTFGYPCDRLIDTAGAIRGYLATEGAEVAVLEIADGILQHETRALVERLPGFADRVVLAVGDALGAVAGLKILTELGVGVAAVSGLITVSPLASREAAAATGLPVITPGEYAAGAALDLIPVGGAPRWIEVAGGAESLTTASKLLRDGAAELIELGGPSV